MHTTVLTLKVFLASPGDVKPERTAAEELVHEMNKQLRTFGWQIMLYMWEDVIPGFGRPQETINASVDECAVFLGLLWEKWGQQTGKYSSGFEEEFERALARRKETGEPEIWMVFKAVNADKIKDPGTELSRVLEFRNRQTSLREVLYKEVSASNDWKSKLTNWLWSYVFRLNETSRSPQPDQPTSNPERQSIEAPKFSDVQTPETEISQQLLVSATSLTKAIKNTELEAVRHEEGTLQQFDVARLFLVSGSMMFRWYTGETFQTHETNLIYLHRRRLELIPIEHFQLLRALVADSRDVVPGWFWFTEMTLEAVREQLLVLAEQDSSIDVRRRALWLLRQARIPLPEYLWVSLPLWDTEDSVRSAALKYLVETADEKVLPLLDALSTSENTSIASSARETRFSILITLRPDEAFSQMVETGEHVSDAKIAQLKEAASSISEAELLKGAQSQWEQIRKFAVEELAKRRRLPKKIGEKLTDDPSVTIRGVAFMDLARQGEPIDFDKVKKALSGENQNLGGLYGLLALSEEHEIDADSVILTSYRSRTAEAVAAAIEWYSVEGPLAYKCLATDHFSSLGDTLRTDLETGFERVKQLSIENIKAHLGEEISNKTIEKLKRYDDFIRSQFTEAALAGLVANGQPSDLRFGRQYLSSDQRATKLAAVRIVCRFGTEEDVPALLDVTRDSWGDAKDEAGACALRLSPTPLEIARELTHNNSPKLVQAGYAWLYHQRSQEAADLFEGLIDSGDDKERVRSVYYLSKTRTSEELENLLEANLQKEKYYYNVVAWLDRLLYSPEPLKNLFERKLEEEAT